MTLDKDILAAEAEVGMRYAELTMARNAVKVAHDAWDESRIRYWDLVQEKTREMCGHDGGLGAPGYLRQGFGP